MTTQPKKRPIYLDYHSTTPVDPRVAEKVVYFMTTAFGNPSSVTHSYSDEAEEAVKIARENVAELIGADPKEIIFTSGATESINLALLGCIQKDSGSKQRVAVLPVEHKAIITTCKKLEKCESLEIVYLKVDSVGKIDLDFLEKICSEGISLLCVMAANNEIGNIYPIEKIGEIAEKYSIPFLCDATQAIGKIPVHFHDSKITMLALSAHKMYGPKGIGALVIKKGFNLKPILCGGGQQKGIRPGTLNVPGIVGLGEACRIRKLEMEEDEKNIRIKRDRMQHILEDSIPNLIINGDINAKLAGNLSISIPNIHNADVIAKVRDKVAISTGSACTSGFEAPSHVLEALELSEKIIGGTLRIGIGKYTTDSEIDEASEIIIAAISQLQNINV